MPRQGYANVCAPAEEGRGEFTLGSLRQYAAGSSFTNQRDDVVAVLRKHGAKVGDTQLSMPQSSQGTSSSWSRRLLEVCGLSDVGRRWGEMRPGRLRQTNGIASSGEARPFRCGDLARRLGGRRCYITRSVGQLRAGRRRAVLSERMFGVPRKKGREIAGLADGVGRAFSIEECR